RSIRSNIDDHKSYGRPKSGSFRKRSRDQFDNARRKRHNSSLGRGSTTTKPIDTIYRILSPVKKIGSVLGKGGEIINALRGVTHAKIRVADAVPGAEERVVMIFCYLWQSERNDSDQDPYDTDGIELEDMRVPLSCTRCFTEDPLLDNCR
ncbi:unnamed protein product, partial [Musa banksii]